MYLMQKKIVRIMHCVKPRNHTKALFEDAKILNIFQINKYIIGTFMYKSHTLDIFTSKFAYNSSIHAHDTRQSDHFHVHMIKRELSKSNKWGAVIMNDVMKYTTKVITYFSRKSF